MNLHDHQHWHLENTLTFTPFKDIEITKLILQLAPEDLIKHFKDAVIKLANDFGIEIPYVKNLDNVIDYKSQDFAITDEINKFFEKNLDVDKYSKSSSTFIRYLS